MFTEKTLTDIENFISAYFPFYLDDWNRLSADEKNLLVEMQRMTNLLNENDYLYADHLRQLSQIATGLICFPVCKDYYSAAGNNKNDVCFEEVEKAIRERSDYSKNQFKILKLMEKNPAAITVYYIWISFNYRLAHISKDELLRKVIKNQKEKIADIGKGLKVDDYYRAIDSYFDANPLKNISYRFRKDKKNVLEFSCFANDSGSQIELLRADLKYAVPLIQYVDENWFELCTEAFIKDAEKTVQLRKTANTPDLKDSLEGSLYDGIQS